MLLLLASAVLLLMFAAKMLRLILRPLRHDHHNPYRYGCRRHHGVLGGVLPVVALVILDRLLQFRRF